MAAPSSFIQSISNLMLTRSSVKKLFEARPHARIEELFLVASQGMLDSLIRHEPDYGNKYEKEAGYPNTHIGGQGRRQVE